jgi:hypothetical membrane protein
MRKLERSGWFITIRHVVRWIAAFVPAVFVVLSLAVHLLNPDVDWVRYTLSDLALGHYGWIESVSMFVFGLCLLGVAFGLRHAVRPYRCRWLKSATNLLALTALCFSATAVFRTNNTDIVTTGIIIHRVAVITITLAFPAACFLLLPALKCDSRWRDMAVYCAVAAVISVVLDIAAVSVSQEVQQKLAGLWEKTSIANALIWCQVFALRVFVDGRGSSEAWGGKDPAAPGSQLTANTNS